MGLGSEPAEGCRRPVDPARRPRGKGAAGVGRRGRSAPALDLFAARALDLPRAQPAPRLSAAEAGLGGGRNESPAAGLNPARHFLVLSLFIEALLYLRMPLTVRALPKVTHLAEVMT